MVAQGQDIGKFEFGGSCVVLVFQSGMITVDSDLLFPSGSPVETRLLMGQRIGASPQYGKVPAPPNGTVGLTPYGRR